MTAEHRCEVSEGHRDPFSQRAARHPCKRILANTILFKQLRESNPDSLATVVEFCTSRVAPCPEPGRSCIQGFVALVQDALDRDVFGFRHRERKVNLVVDDQQRAGRKTYQE